jgi:hypothetical protein
VANTKFLGLSRFGPRIYASVFLNFNRCIVRPRGASPDQPFHALRYAEHRRDDDDNEPPASAASVLPDSTVITIEGRSEGTRGIDSLRLSGHHVGRTIMLKQMLDPGWPYPDGNPTERCSQAGQKIKVLLNRHALLGTACIWLRYLGHSAFVVLALMCSSVAYRAQCDQVFF